MNYRVNDILRRMEDNKLQPDTMKTCFGILAIMSREEPNKQIIAREGMEMILAIMISHLDKIDVQESGCDLLWSLAFNNVAIKDIIADNCGASVVVSALKRHSKSGDFLKSACGALSNMCQSKMNQEAVACQGGLRPLVDAINTHQSNGRLLLFIFDALASVIVGNEENARMVSSLGFIPLVIASIGQHKSSMDVVKSACHTLAILSDVKGQASSIAFAGGVPVILSLLDMHANYADLHRVAAVVLLRMLQESVHVGREIATQEGVRILLKSLEKGGAQHDTVAAVTHILFTITNPSTSLTSIESQLWLTDAKSVNSDCNIDLNGKSLGGRLSSSVANIRCGNSSTDFLRSTGRNVLAGQVQGQGQGQNILSNAANKVVKSNADINAIMDAQSYSSSSSLAGLVQVIGQYCERRDVVRASCRLLVNINHYSGVTNALDKLGILEKLLDCVNIHREARDVVESTALLLKGIHRRNPPSELSNKSSIVGGLLTVFQNKIKDEEVAKACADLFLKMIETPHTDVRTHVHNRSVTSSSNSPNSGQGNGQGQNQGGSGNGNKIVLTISEYRSTDGKVWEYEALNLAVKALEQFTVGSGVGGKRPGSPAKKELDVKSARDRETDKDEKKERENENDRIETGPPKSASLRVIPMSASRAATPWTKHTPKSVSSLLTLIEALSALSKLSDEHVLLEYARQTLQYLLIVLPVRNSDITRKIERLLSKLHNSNTTVPFRSEDSHIVSTPPGSLFPVLSSRSMSSSRPNSKETSLIIKEGSLNAKDAASSSGAKVINTAPKGRSAASQVHSGFKYYRMDETVQPRKFYPLHPLKITSGSGNGCVTGTGGGGGVGNCSSSSAININSNSSSSNNGTSTSTSTSTSTGGRDKDKDKDNSVATGASGSGSGYGTGTVTGSGSGSGVGMGAPRLLDVWPNYLERLCPSCGPSREFMSAPSTADRMHLVYESASAAGRGVMSKCHTPVPYDVPAEGLGDPFAHSLTFDSEFECGNLLRAVQRGDSTYDLCLRSDLHTEGNTQWFYFAVSNTHPAGVVKLSEQGVQVLPVRIRFNIVNLTKPDSLFNSGMRPVVYSCADAGTRGVGWVRSGSDISYYSNNHARNNHCGEGNSLYYTLSFTVEFHNPKDTVLIAYSYPYSVSDYKSHIRDILHRPSAFDIIRSSRLCTTLGGENCDLLVITNFKDKLDKERIGPVTVSAMETEAMTWNSSSSKKAASGSTRGNPLNPKLKPALFFSGRVHPGETPASWMMKGMIEFLTGDSPQANLLRQIYVIYIVPILNPDGVIYGNNRCSLSGVDLNRQWKVPLKATHPTIFALKNFMYMMRKMRDVNMYIDLHGHSRKYNVFMYGCDDKKKGKPLVRAFPKFFSSHSVGGKYVNYSDCSFHVRKGRESTARVVVSRELNIPLSFTLEATFCGSNYGPYQDCHMNIGHMQEVGASLCDAVLQFSIAENLIKDILVIPPTVKIKKERADSAKTDAENSSRESREGGKELTRGSSMEVVISGLKDLCVLRDKKEIEQEKAEECDIIENAGEFSPSSVQGNRRDKKIVAFNSTIVTSSATHSEASILSDTLQDDKGQLHRRDSAGNSESGGEEGTKSWYKDGESRGREREKGTVRVRGRRRLKSVDGDGRNARCEGEGEREEESEGEGNTRVEEEMDIENDVEGEGEGEGEGGCDSGSEGDAEGDADADGDGDRDDSDSDFPDAEENICPTGGYPQESFRGTRPGVPDDVINYTDNLLRRSSDDKESSLKNGDSSEDVTSAIVKGKKERKRPDLPPLGKSFIPVTSQLSSHGSAGNLLVLAPLMVSCGSLSPHSTSPVPGDCGSFHGAVSTLLQSTTLPLTKEMAFGEERLRRTSPTPLVLDDAAVKMKEDYSSARASASLDDGRHNSSLKFSHIMLSEDKKERDKDRSLKDLKDLIVIDGIDKRANVGLSQYGTHTRRTTGNIVTGHSLLQTSSSLKEPLALMGLDMSSESITISNSASSHHLHSSTGDEKQMSTPSLSSTLGPHITLCGSNIFKIDPTESGISFSDTGNFKVQGPGGLLKSTVKPARISRTSFSDSSISSSVDITADTLRIAATRRNSFLIVAAKKKKKRK